MNKGVLIDQLFSGGTALAGLILVFLGGLLTAYDSYSAVDKRAVSAKYRARARLALAGFVCALASAIISLAASWLSDAVSTLGLYLGLLTLLASFLFLTIAGISAVREI